MTDSERWLKLEQDLRESDRIVNRSLFGIVLFGVIGISVSIGLLAYRVIQLQAETVACERKTNAIRQYLDAGN